MASVRGLLNIQSLIELTYEKDRVMRGADCRPTSILAFPRDAAARASATALTTSGTFASALTAAHASAATVTTLTTSVAATSVATTFVAATSGATTSVATTSVAAPLTKWSPTRGHGQSD